MHTGYHKRRFVACMHDIASIFVTNYSLNFQQITKLCTCLVLSYLKILPKGLLILILEAFFKALAQVYLILSGFLSSSSTYEGLSCRHNLTMQVLMIVVCFSAFATL